MQASLQELDAEKAAAAFDAAGTDLAAATLQDAVRQTWQIADLAHHKLADQTNALATRIDDAEAQLAQAKTFDPVGTGLDATDSDRALRQTWQIADLAHHKLAEPSGVTPGTYGGGTTAPVLTVDERGRVTGAATAPITPAAIGAAEAGHTHDDRYYTEAEADARFAPVDHTHAPTGEFNTASNLGTGTGLFMQKTGADLQFRSLKAGSNVDVSVVGDDVVISAVGGSGGASTATDNTWSGKNTFTKHINIDPDTLIGSPADRVGGGYYAPITIWHNPTQAELNELPDGVSMGMKIMLTQANVGTPGKTQFVAGGTWYSHTVLQTILAQNDHDRRILWGQNVAVQSLRSTDFGRPARSLVDDDTDLEAVEYEVHNRTLYDERSDWGGSPWNAGAFPKVGIMLTNGSESTADANAAIRIWSAANGQTIPRDQSKAEGWWNKGIIMSKVTRTGIEFNKDPGKEWFPANATDFRKAFSHAAINDKSDSRHVIHVESNTTHDHFAKINGTYVGSMIDTRGSASPKVLTMRDNQELRWWDSNDNGSSGREMSIRMTNLGALQINAHSWDGNMSLKVNDPSLTTKFQVAPNQDNPVYIWVQGRLKQVRAANIGSLGPSVDVLYVV